MSVCERKNFILTVLEKTMPRDLANELVQFCDIDNSIEAKRKINLVIRTGYKKWLLSHRRVFPVEYRARNEWLLKNYLFGDPVMWGFFLRSFLEFEKLLARITDEEDSPLAIEHFLQTEELLDVLCKDLFLL